MKQPLVQIFIVDDDHGHCELIRRNLVRSGIDNPVTVCHDATSALEQLRELPTGKHALVLLDINMPGQLNGIELLGQIKGDVRLHRIPVVMLTTTEDPREVRRCYELGCNAYITKPVGVDQFKEVIRRVGMFVGVVRVAENGDA